MTQRPVDVQLNRLKVSINSLVEQYDALLRSAKVDDGLKGSLSELQVDVAADNVLIASESLLTLIHDLKSMALMLTEPASRELDDVPASASHA